MLASNADSASSGEREMIAVKIESRTKKGRFARGQRWR
jgi:hypothetical protein